MAFSGWTRNSVFADLFYPGNPLQLKTTVERLLVREKEIKKTSFLLVPHAGYIYSGSVAGKTFACSDISKRVIVLGPNHTGFGRPISIWTKGFWKTPLGLLNIDEEISEELINILGKECEDKEGHLKEHSIEVEIPFLQVRYEKVDFVPICVGTENYVELIELGNAISEVVKKFENNVSIIVSCDMNHYERAEINRVKDEAALKAIEKLDSKELYEVVAEKNISMCGYAPCVASISALSKLGKWKVELVDYSHSGVLTNSDEEVVSYAGVRCFKE
ncbi:MAG: AmmeMemoRadiSam system protein B [Acidobacteriota bacterium]